MPACRRLFLAAALSCLGSGQAVAAAGGGEAWTAAQAWGLGSVGLGLLLLLGVSHRRIWMRLQAQAQRNGRLAADNARLRGTSERAEAKARLLDSVLAAMADGVAVVDADQRLAAWNARFPDVAGVPRQALRIGMPMEAVIRLQAEAGEFGAVDPDQEVARRVEVLRTGTWPERWQRMRPDGTRIELRRAALPGGGHVTLYTPLVEAAPLRQDGLAAAFASEWSARLPRLAAAAEIADLEEVGRVAHTLRGIAANAGWSDAVEVLRQADRAVETGDLASVRKAVQRLQPHRPGVAR
jgi:PAS domain-containing protein